MQLIQTLEDLIKSGVSFTFKLATAGENIRLDIVPAGKSNKTGVALPTKALIGTAKEIDEALVEFLPKYAASTTKIADVLANADTELEAAERAATEAARKAVEEKSKSKAKPGTKAGTSTPAKRNLAAGMIDGDSGGDTGSNEEEEEEEGGTTLNTTSSPETAPAAAAAPAAAPAEQTALSPSLF